MTPVWDIDISVMADGVTEEPHRETVTAATSATTPATTSAATSAATSATSAEHYRCRSTMDFDTRAALLSALLEGTGGEEGNDAAPDSKPAAMGTASNGIRVGNADDLLCATPSPEPGSASPNSTATAVAANGDNGESSTPLPPHHVVPADADWKLTNYDEKNSFPQTLEEELQRLTTLRDYSILDSEREEQFERITALTSRIFDVPIALVSLVDLGRQWFMSNRGLGDVRETPRNLAFCAHSILSKEDVFVVPDASLDTRFKNTSLVTGAPDIRFYAGAPLLSPEGYKLGTLCIIDTKPWPTGMSLHEKQNLLELSAMVMDTLVNRKRELDRLSDEKTRLIACAAHDLLTPLTGLQLNLGLVIDDDKLATCLDDQQREYMMTAVSCSEIMGRICIQAIESFRGKFVGDRKKGDVIEGGENGNGGGSNGDLVASGNHGGADENDVQPDNGALEKGAIKMDKLVESIGQVIGPYPKKVPLSIEVDDSVPEIIISDDLKLFRSTVNYLTNACKHTMTGSINLRMYVRKAVHSEADVSTNDHRPGALTGPSRDVLVVECQDTGPGIELCKYSSLFTPIADIDVDGPRRVGHRRMSNSGLGLFSVANAIDSLGGEYGAFLREDLVTNRNEGDSNHPDTSSELNGPDVTGSVFWFSVPLVLPRSAASSPSSSMEARQQIQQKLPPSIELPPQPCVARSKLSTDEQQQKQKRQPSLQSIDNGAITMKEVDITTAVDTMVETISDSKPPRRPVRRPVRKNKRSFPAQDSMEEEEDDDMSISTPRLKKPTLGSSDRLAEDEDMSTSTPRLKKRLADVSRNLSGVSIMSIKLQSSANHSTPQPQQPPRRKKRVIVIDDSLTIRKGLARGFSRLGFEVDEAENGLQGLKKMKETAYELVVLDFLMPVMDGLDVAKKYRSWEAIHRTWYHQYIVGISAHANGKDAELGIKSGMDRFMGKPVPLKSLKDLANCKSVTDASIVLDKNFQEALERENSEEDKSAPAGNCWSDTSSCSLSDHAVRRYCLIAENSKPTVESLQRKIERSGWRAVVVHNGDDALRLLKMRNWDTVLIDDDLPNFSGSSCVVRFRDWETRSRVVRQKNLFMISSHYSPQSKVILPDGFDGALGKPLDNTKLGDILDRASKEHFKCNREILLR